MWSLEHVDTPLCKVLYGIWYVPALNSSLVSFTCFLWLIQLNSQSQYICVSKTRAQLQETSLCWLAKYTNNRPQNRQEAYSCSSTIFQ